MPSQHYWLMKSEPESYSIDHLLKAKNQATLWDGVRNYQARNTLRDSMKVGDLAFFYHSNCAVPGIAGIVKIIRTGIADPTAFDPQSEYFDPKSTPDNPRWITVEVQFVEKLKNLLPLAEIRNNPKLANFTLLRKGNRLSVFSVTKQEWQILTTMITRKSHDIAK